MLKCEARIAEIVKIEIITKMRTLDVGDYETFELIGYDSQGNAFTSLEGLKFSWWIEQPNNFAEFVTLRSASIHASEKRLAIEDSRSQSDIIVMRGDSTGLVKVHSKVAEEGYKNVQSQVPILIVEHFMIFPERDIYVLPYTDIDFSLYAVKMSKKGSSFKEISLPNKNYSWGSRNQEIAKITSSGLLSSFKDLGATQVYVEDMRGKENRVENRVTVVDPWRLDLQVKLCQDFTDNSPDSDCFSARLPYFLAKNKAKNAGFISFGEKFYLVLGQTYLFKAVIFDQRDNSIMLGSNSELKWNLPSNVQIIRTRGDELIVKAIEVSQKNADLKLVGVKRGSNNYKPKNIKTSKLVEVSLPLKIYQPQGQSEIVLPFIEGKSGQRYRLRVLGGSKHVSWQSNDPKVAIVNSDGEVIAVGLGTTSIVVSDDSNPTNQHFVTVVVENVSKSVFVEVNKELEISKTDYTYIFSSSTSHRKFSNCTNVGYSFKSSHPQYIDVSTYEQSYNVLVQDLDERAKSNEYFYRRVAQGTNSNIRGEEFDTDFQRILTSQLKEYEQYLEAGLISKELLKEWILFYNNYGICGALELKALKYLETGLELYASMIRSNGNEQGSRGTQSQLFLKGMQTTMPEIATQIQSHTLLLAHGSSLEWQVEGGPTEWGSWKTLSQKFLGGSSLERVYTIDEQQSSSQSIKRFRVLCNQDSELRYDTIELEVSNPACIKLIYPLVMKVGLKMGCGKPQKLKIFRGKESTYLTSDVYENIQKVSSLTRKSGSQTLDLQKNRDYYFQVWAFSQEMTPFYNFSSLDLAWSSDHPATRLIDDSSLVFENEQNKDEVVTASFPHSHSVIKLKSSVEGYEQKQSYNSEFGVLQDEVEVRIIDLVQVSSQHYVLLNKKGVIGNLDLIGGSGDFKLETTDSTIAAVTFLKKQRKIQLVPKRKGQFKITVVDQSPDSASVVEITVKVVDPHSMRLEIDPELVKSGEEVRAIVQLYDQDGDQIPREQASHFGIDLQYSPNSPRNMFKDFQISKLGVDEYAVSAVFSGSGFKQVPLTATSRSETQTGSFSLKASNEYYVFSQLQAFPSEVYTSNSCRFGIKFLFEVPESSSFDISLGISIEDPSIIELTKKGSNFATFRALKKGKTTVTAWIEHGRGLKTNNKLTVPVLIGDITGLTFLNQASRNVHVGAPVRLIAQPLVSGYHMSPSFCQVFHQWESSFGNFVEFTDLEVLKEGVNSSFPSDFGSRMATNLVGKASGEAEIRATIKVTDENGYLLKRLTATTSVNFVDSLDVKFPGYMGGESLQSDHLLIPPGSGYQLNISSNSQNLRFTNPCEDCESLYQVDSNGFVTTGTQKGSGILVINDPSKHGSYRAVNFLITDVFALIVEDSYKANILAKDSMITLNVRFQDESGRLFPSPLQGKSVEVIVSQAGIISTSLEKGGSQLRIQGVGEGRVLVSVHYSDDPSIFDVFKVEVGSLVKPTGPISVHVGTKIKFEAVSSSLKSSNMTWSSLEPQILKMQPEGTAIAQKPGNTIVTLKGGVFFQTKVQVFEADRVEINILDGSELLTNIYDTPDSTHRAIVKVYQGTKEITTLFTSDENIDPSLDLSCAISEQEWFEVKATISEDGVPYCEFRPKKVYPSNAQFPESIIISATVTSRATVFSLSGSTVGNYKWGFQGQGEDSDQVRYYSFDYPLLQKTLIFRFI